MLYSQLGNTGTFVSRICFGTMTFGGAGTIYSAIGGLTQEQASALIGQTLDAGVNFFDTANVYAAGESETMLGKALGAKRRDVIVASKVFGRVDSGANSVGLSRVHILRAVEDSLKRLGPDSDGGNAERAGRGSIILMNPQGQQW